MKNIIIIVILVIAFSCKAQSPILPYNTMNIPENAYCKDLNNDLDKFVGTWKYVNGNTELVVTIVKNIQVDLDSYYTDELSGNYKYVENGIVVINTLNNNANEEASFSGSELSNDLKSFSFASFFDPDKLRASYSLDIKYLGTDLMTGEIQMEWKLMQTGFYTGYLPGETPPTPEELDQTIRIPMDLILVKQG